MTTNQLKFAEIRENTRHNRAMESYNVAGVQENIRHNQAFEDINWYNAFTDRGYKTSAAQAALEQASAAQRQAAASQRQAENAFLNVLELQRHNREVESQDNVVKASQAGLNWARANETNIAASSAQYTRDWILPAQYQQMSNDIYNQQLRNQSNETQLWQTQLRSNYYPFMLGSEVVGSVTGAVGNIFSGMKTIENTIQN